MAYKEEKILKDLPEIKKNYKTRILESDKGEKTIDIREYTEGNSYTGFTKRGLRLNKDQVQKAIDVLTKALNDL